MIYTVFKTIPPQTEGQAPEVKEFEIDDTVFFNDQPHKVRDIIEEYRQGDTAVFDNATIYLVKTGRVLVTIKNI